MKTLGWKKRASGALYVLVLTLGLGSLGRAATNVWTPKADMPTARYLPAACAVDGKIYVVGGALSHHVVIAAAEVYDPATHAWTRKADMPVASAGMGAAVVDGKIYVMGGLLSLRSTYEYDPAANAWTRKADMPTGRALLCASAVKGKIYAIGGAVDTPGPAFTTVEGYDPATDTWTRKADAPTARAWLSASALNGRIYVIGGVFGVNGTMYLAGGDSGPRRASVEEYDPATDIWTTRSDLPTPRGGLSTVSLNGRVYAVGGMKTFWDSFVTVEEYDPYPLIVDFNGDGIVDTSDLLPLIESWGRNDPAVDIGPRPCGDGIIDATDLEILMGYWGQEVQDSTLRAHWKLDEAEGSLASDSAGNGAGTVVGVPAWQPAGGVRGGALEFDGTAFIRPIRRPPQRICLGERRRAGPGDPLPAGRRQLAVVGPGHRRAHDGVGQEHARQFLVLRCGHLRRSLASHRVYLGRAQPQPLRGRCPRGRGCSCRPGRLSRQPDDRGGQEHEPRRLLVRPDRRGADLQPSRQRHRQVRGPQACRSGGVVNPAADFLAVPPGPV
jgi:N-acetylneuraminic acid mutarotase